jgi:hypothetical protein
MIPLLLQRQVSLLRVRLKLMDKRKEYGVPALAGNASNLTGGMESAN